MNKLKLTGQNLGRVFNSRLERVCIYCTSACMTKRPNIKLKTEPKQLLGSLPLAFALPEASIALSLLGYAKVVLIQLD